MMLGKKRVTLERLRELLRYDPWTGRFFWLVARSNIQAGMEAGTVLKDHNCTYMRLCIDGHRYSAHHLVWLYANGEWPSSHIDHIDVNGLNNRIDNLRLATTAENTRNSRLSRRNTSGFKGVTYDRWRCRWKSAIKVIGKSRHLGYFDTPEAAHAAYRAAAKNHFGEFARFE